MHSSPNDTDEAIDVVRKFWKGPLGAYPESGYFKMPEWTFVDIIAPEDLVAKARDWQKKGVTASAAAADWALNIFRPSQRSLQNEDRILSLRRREVRNPWHVAAGHCLPLHSVPQADGNLHVCYCRRRRRHEIQLDAWPQMVLAQAPKHSAASAANADRCCSGNVTAAPRRRLQRAPSMAQPAPRFEGHIFCESAGGSEIAVGHTGWTAGEPGRSPRKCQLSAGTIRYSHPHDEHSLGGLLGICQLGERLPLRIGRGTRT